MSSNDVFLSSACLFSKEEFEDLRSRPVPRHVAIIMDGNRRWVKKQLSGAMHLHGGHWAGANTLTTIVEAASELGIKVLTVYGFSTENWGRSSEEVEALLEILHSYLELNCQKMVDQNIRFHPIGDLSPFSIELQRTIKETSLATERGKGMDFVIALNYGGRDEIRRAIQKIVGKVMEGTFTKEAISEETIASHLDTAPFGDPDLLIRTSGEKRISNFLLWQLAYAEVYLTETLWPDFTPRELLKAVLDFQQRQRRIGK